MVKNGGLPIWCGTVNKWINWQIIIGDNRAGGTYLQIKFSSVTYL